jgi:hypothetical protein
MKKFLTTFGIIVLTAVVIFGIILSIIFGHRLVYKLQYEKYVKETIEQVLSEKGLAE